MRASGQLADKPYRWCFFYCCFWFRLLVNRVISPFLKVFFGTLQNLDQSLVSFVEYRYGLSLLCFLRFLTMGFLESCTWVFYHFVVFPKFSWILFTNSWVLVGLPCVLVLWCSTTLPFHIDFSSLFKMDIVFIKVCPSGSFILCSYLPGFWQCASSGGGYQSVSLSFGYLLTYQLLTNFETWLTFSILT